jgi:curved DNA-binding protein CbpA
MTVTEARRTIFRIAELVDDGHRTVKSAYRTASRKLHPDTGASAAQEEQFKLLSLAKSVLEKAGMFR